MPKVYIAAAFRSMSERNLQDKGKAYGTVVDPRYIAFLESIEDVFLRHGFETCLPHRDEGMWGHAYFDPADISALCFRHIENSDVIFGIAENGRGVHIEFGYAARAGKRMILAYQSAKEPSTLIWGFPRDLSPWQLGFGGETDTTIFSFESQADLLTKLESVLNQGKSEKQPRDKVWSRTTTGIIDIGSHTIKLRIFKHGKGAAPGLLHESKQSLGIIAGVTSTGRIEPDAIVSLLQVLQHYADLCAKHECSNVVAVGTAALRKATNSVEVLATIKQRLGLEVTVLTPETELRYVYSAVRPTFDRKNNVAVLNLGGGSTQVGVGTSAAMQHSFLLPFGTRQLTERWPWKDGFQTHMFAEMQDFVRNHLADLRKCTGQCRIMVHTGGELDFLLRCRVPLQLCKESGKHVSEIPVEMFKRFALQFMQLNASDVATRFKLDPAWAAGAVASNTIAITIAEALGASVIVPSNLNVTDGIIDSQNIN
jgi:Ppx/GppA phosphatase family